MAQLEFLLNNSHVPKQLAVPEPSSLVVDMSNKGLGCLSWCGLGSVGLHVGSTL